MHMVDLSWLRLKVYLAKNKRHVRARPGYIQFIQKRRLTAAEQNTVHDASDETEKNPIKYGDHMTFLSSCMILLPQQQ